MARINLAIPTLAISVLLLVNIRLGSTKASLFQLVTLLSVLFVLFEWRRRYRMQMRDIKSQELNSEEMAALKPLALSFIGFYFLFGICLFILVYFDASQLVQPLIAVWIIRKELWYCLIDRQLGASSGPSQINRWASWIIYSLSGYLLVCAFMCLIQRSLIYFPDHEEMTSKLEPWWNDDKVIGYYREVTKPTTVWLMMHGNAGQASMRDYVLPHLPADNALYVLEYPGYGQREGSPGREAIDRAVSEAYEVLLKQYPGTPIGVIGESIGSGPASQTARYLRPPDKIVLIVPFDVLDRVVSDRFFWLPVQWLLFDNWNNIEALKNYRGQLSIYAARHDEVIAFPHARRLADEIPSAEFVTLQGGHNDWSQSPIQFGVR